MTRLNQLLGVEKGVRERWEKTRSEVVEVITKPEPFTGISRTYKPRLDDGEQYPPESKQVQVTVADVTDRLAKAVGRFWDVTATRDKTNTEAVANVVVGGNVLLRDVPASFLVWFEKQLADLRSILVRLPVLDPAERWEDDESTRPGVYQSQEAKTVRPHKVVNFRVAYEATEFHPAQVVQTSTDEPEGDWTTIKFSGAIFETRRRQLMERIDALIEAVTFAREEANMHDVTDLSVSDAVLSYLFAG